jgi:hypothetical protein
MNDDKINKPIENLKKSIDLLILIEICKAGATRNQAREIIGSLDNNIFSKVSSVFGGNKNHG